MLTRDPAGRRAGRTAVLDTAARSLESLGLTVEAVVLSRRPPSETWDGRRLHHAPLPSLMTVSAAAAAVLVRRRRTLNEALFDSRRARRRTRDIARARGACIVVADGLRTAEPALATGLPVVVHLDDLLSDRYAAMAGASVKARSPSPEDVLGFFAEQLPRALRGPAAAVAARLLALESRLADRRERQLAHSATAVAMTSRVEADELQLRTGRAVAALPMAVDVRPPGDPAAADPTSFVFLGLLDYAPNRAALRWWVEAVRPALDALGGSDVHLTVVGHNSRPQEFSEDARLTFTGYVDDLGAELRRHRGMVAPVVSGAGVKTKVLDGWSVALPVVATEAGAAGLDWKAGLILAHGARDFAEAVLRLRDDATLAGDVGRQGRDALQRSWSAPAIARDWAAVVLPVLRQEPPADVTP